MKINIKRLITDYNSRTGEGLNIYRLAKEMAELELYTNWQSANSGIYQMGKGIKRKVRREVLEYLKERFKLTETEILTN